MENHGSNNQTRRALTPEQKRRILEKRRKAKMKKRLMVALPIAAVLLVALIAIIVFSSGNDVPVEQPALTALPTLAVEMAADDAAEPEVGMQDVADQLAGGALEAEAVEPEGEAVVPAAATAAPDSGLKVGNAVSGNFDYDAAYVKAALGQSTGPALTYDYYSKIDPQKLTRWTEAKEGYIPILFKAETDEKIIAVTVDDCFQGNNLMQIIQCAEQNDADLTIFPIGDNLNVDTVANALRYAYQTGHEIGNHTYNHAGMYHYKQERMEQELWYQQMKVNETLGVNYEQHFFRPKGGDEREDQRVHAYVNQLGYSGVAMWTQSGSTDSLDSLFNNLAPGRIYLFHTTNNDLNKLLKFIPGAVQRGYKLVTLSDMFGLGENKVSELTMTMENQPPKLEAFEVKVPTLKTGTSTTYIRAAAVVQERLIELGWLEGEADGVYGKSSFIATGLFQMESGIKPTGKADPETQKLLFSNDAPAATAEKIAALYKQLGKSAPK